MRLRHAILHALFWIPDHNVRISPRDKRSLARIQAEYFRWVRGRVRHELIRRDVPCLHAVGPHDGHAVFDPWQAVRDFCEIVRAEFLAWDGDLLAFINNWLRAIKEKRTMVRADGLQCPVVQTLPQPRIVFFGPHRRRADPLRAIGTI